MLKDMAVGNIRALLLCLPFLLGMANAQTVNTADTISTLEATTAAAGAVYYVKGYNVAGDGGGGIFQAVSGTITGDTCVNFSGIGGIHWVRQLNGAVLTVDNCGAYGDGTHPTQTQAAFQAANDYVAVSSNPNQTIRMPGASYNLGSGSTPAVIKSSSFFGPKWIGNGMSTGLKGTTITFAPTSEAAAFQFIGGSGAACGCGVENVIFTGNTNAIGVEFQGQGGGNVDISTYGPMKLAVLLHNKTSGQFTEFDTLTVNSNGSNIGTVLEYRVTSGNVSFHGSGLVGGVVNYNTSGTNSPAVLIGAGAFPYNAPLSATFFPNQGSPSVIVQNNSNTTYGEAWFFGNVKVEQGGAASVVMGSGYDFILNGDQSFFGNAAAQKMGNMYLANTFGSTPSSVGIVNFKPVGFEGAISAAVTHIPWASNMNNQSWKVTIEVRGPNYTAQATADLLQDAGTGNFAVLGQQNNIINDAVGYGNIALYPAPGYFAFRGSTIEYPNSGFSYYVTLSQIGQSASYHSQQ
jgi:hypothetical protein